MSLQSSGINATNSLAEQIFRRLDTNGDSKLSADEFKSFFEKLLEQLPAAGTTPGVGSASTAVVRPAATDPSPVDTVKPLTTYAPAPGWVTSRLNNPTDNSPKYQFQRAIQDLGNPAPTTENLKNLVIPYLQSKGMNISLKEGSNDVVMINDSPYPQDVIRDVGGPDAAWQYINTPEANAYYWASHPTSV
jgi:hypothetical protein